MISKTITLLLLFVYSAVIFQPAFKYAAFKINQQFIVKNICVQKDYEENFCQGGCYLKQEMNEANEGSTKSTVPSKINISELNLEFIVSDKSDSKQIFRVSNLADILFISTITKEYTPLIPPPKC
jgi:hypothetical protein